MKRPNAAMPIADLRILRRSGVQERLGLFWIEGSNCLEVALQANWPVVGVFGTDEWVKTNGLSYASNTTRERRGSSSPIAILLERWQQSQWTDPQSEINLEIVAALSSITESWQNEFPDGVTLKALKGFHHISAKDLGKIADANSPDGIVALCLTPDLRKRAQHGSMSRGRDRDDPTLARTSSSQLETAALAVYQLQDPGNLGSLLRTSVATGASDLVLSPGSVDPTHPKVLRSTAGQWFKSPPRRCRSDEDFESWLIDCRKHGVQVVATEVSSDENLRHGNTAPREGKVVVELWSLDLSKPTVFLLGNEARGLPPHLRELATHLVHIPMENDVESLNVGVAGAILLYEAMRQRRSGGRTFSP